MTQEFEVRRYDAGRGVVGFVLGWERPKGGTGVGNQSTTAERILQRLLTADDSPIPRGEPGSDWGSPKRYRQQLILDEAGGTGHPSGAIVFPDGSSVSCEPFWPNWEAHDASWLADRESGVMPNGIGLTRFRSISFDVAGQASLTDQLEAAGAPYGRVDIPNIVGMGGNAYLIFYTSPSSGRPVTVLVVPVQADVDQFHEDLYYFEGIGPEEARSLDWLVLYDKARALTF